MKALFCATSSNIHFWFQCSKSFDKLQVFSNDDIVVAEDETKSAILRVVNHREDGKVFIFGWYGNKHNEQLCMSAHVKYEKNRCYSIDFDLDKHTPGTKEHLCITEPPHDYAEVSTGDNALRITIHIPYKKAKKELKELIKAKLIDKPSYDPWCKGLDILCRACHVKGEPVECLSNPSYGKVLELSEHDDPRFKDVKFRQYKDSFIFKGILYRKIKARDWYTTRYWNEEEYKEVAKYYYDHGFIRDRFGGINEDNLKKWQKDWPPFEENRLYYRDKETRKVFTEQTKPEWEPVATKGWCTEPYPGSTDCPVCKRIYQITNAYPEWSTKVSTLVGKLKFALLRI